MNQSTIPLGGQRDNSDSSQQTPHRLAFTIGAFNDGLRTSFSNSNCF